MKNFYLCLVATFLLLSNVIAVKAKTIRIVALGASDATGYGVGADQAWPAQLERILRSKGYNVSVTVEAISGNSSAEVLARADSAASGARFVVFDGGGANDRKHGLSASNTRSNIAQINAHIRAHGAIPIQNIQRATQADGVHSTPQGHAAAAAAAAARIIAVLGKSKS